MEMCKKPINGEDYAPITQALRGRLKVAALGLAKPMADGLLAECDNIDAIHRSLKTENERLRDASERDDDWIKLPVDAEAPSKQLADWIERRGLVTGPLDANGELWHSGDMSDSNWGVIERIYFNNNVWFISGHDTSAPWIRADSIAHYHPDTWESIIEDATKLGFTDPDNEHLRDKLIARCKALCEHTREGEE